MNYVYLMRSGERYKIGRARDVGRRWRTFRTADPTIRVEHVIPTDQAAQLEAELHRVFDHKHIDLEWFHLAPDDVRFIKSLGGNAGRWLLEQQKRRQRLKRAIRLARRVVRLGVWLVFNAAIIYFMWRVVEWSIPVVEKAMRIK